MLLSMIEGVVWVIVGVVGTRRMTTVWTPGLILDVPVGR